MAKKRIPVVVVAGFLGSGKTTLLNHVLHDNRGVRVGVIVNDFGAVNIDSMLVAGQVDSMVSLSNGCMCCAVDVSDMDEMLDRLANPSSQIDVIVVEASGLAEPRNMIRLVLGSGNPHVVYGGLVVMVDGEQFEQTSDQHPELVKHVALADLVVLNKMDRIDGDRRAVVEAMVRTCNERVPIVATAHGRVDPALLFDREPGREPAPGEQLTLDRLLLDQHEECGDHEHFHSTYEAVDFSSTSPIDPRRLVDFLEERPVGIYRIKGFVHFAVPGQSRKFELHTVGPHIRFTSTRWEPGEDRSTQLVLIGTGIDAEHVRTRVAECVVTDGEAVTRGVVDPGAMLGVHRYTVTA
ncbi:MAG: GTP-binding protein [Rhodococcus sp. (in: high G+C Gram-positive bacteria)]|uniref:CobW family GTP-binding protein n=1 Tax=Rhodococcus sp. TaxID=1831 RepID=UPI003BB1BC9F